MTYLTLRKAPPGRPRTICRAALLVVVLVLGALAPATAAAAPTAAVTALLEDCAVDGVLDRTYSGAEYQGALENIPTDLDEYSDCRAVIRQAQLAAGGAPSRAGGSDDGAVTAAGSAGGGSGTGTGSTAGVGGGLAAYENAVATATPQERAALARATTDGPVAIELAGQRVSPDSLARGDLAASNRIPAPLVLVLVLLAGGLLMMSAVRRLPERLTIRS
ncbi:hypothetical protein DSM112329_03390 [Paraconexibacter sp. AEG42_29]|uniref:Uncharacterized protein n=1 Tax=Paraconexibacter sp. AEG42_29 TaxID=2997339 RepID=A0AAU7AXQ3_9ACTN